MSAVSNYADAEAERQTELAESHLSFGHQLSQAGRFVDAEASFRRVIELCPTHPMAHNNIGWTREMQGDSTAALANYECALGFDPRLRIARRNLAKLLVRLGRRDESLPLWHAEVTADDDGLAWMQHLVSDTMRHRDLSLAGEYAAILAELRWSSRWYPRRASDSIAFMPRRVPVTSISLHKLRHDIEQFGYLQRLGVLGDEFTPIVADYQRLVERLEPHGSEARMPLEDEVERAIGHVYNRIVHIRTTPRVERALSGAWDPAAMEKQYLNHPPGVVVVDDFLSRDALEGLRLFCLESTVWSANRYAHGRFGAFFHDGFNCPLLLQIAEELREALPRIIGYRHELRQLWGFKNGYTLPPAVTTHADFAAVNVNFWITPTDANLDENSGGLIMYGVDAPLSWDFNTYNGRTDIIEPFLERQQARSVTIPYRQNRAVIFNSDLFHGTDGVQFRPGYENRRVNVTMLYGDREQDSQRITQDAVSSSFSSWRSASFSRARR